MSSRSESTSRDSQFGSLGDLCQYVKGVGPAKASRLRNLGIENVNDLLTHYPKRYYDRRRLTGIASLQVGVDETFVARVLTANGRPRGRGRRVVSAALGDDSGVIAVVWFNQPFLLQHLKPGREMIVSGQLRFYRGQRQIVNPDFEFLSEDLDQTVISGGRIVPVYPLTSGITQRFLRSTVMRVLENYGDAVVENLPEYIVKEHGLITRSEAIRSMHYPEDEEDLERARHRMKIEELFFMLLLLSLQRRLRLDGPRRRSVSVSFALERRYLDSLPFELTGAQKRVLDEIHDDFSSRGGMNRLLQGDVGSGKTVVAGAALLAAVEAGAQAAMMVPTEILALQHFRTLSPYFDALGIKSACLIGSLKAAHKRQVHDGIADGSLGIVIGTHALIQSDVRFKDLGVVVIDEQHRFGVRQRAALLQDGGNPHVLVMTATPIPRTLALIAYADLDLSVMDELPASRAAVRTHIVQPEKREAMYKFIRERQEHGEQSYLLYPLIEETENQDLEAAESAHKELSSGILKGVPVGLLHGRMSTADKERVMKMFAAGEMRVLVSTTVVEVGVHVPAATIMAVHHPERFGLSQLHQLRGRVGRGGREGYCFLLVSDGTSPETSERLEVLVRVADGFAIAEEDLRLRGPGEFLGVRQHGVPGFKVANPQRDRGLVEVSQSAVKKLLDEDPTLASPTGIMCRRHLSAAVNDDIVLRAVV